MLKKLFSKDILIQICQYFVIIIAVVILFYILFSLIYARYFAQRIEQIRGALSASILRKDMLAVECTTIFPILIPFTIVFGYIRSKRIYIPVIAVILVALFFPFVFRNDLYNIIRNIIVYLITIIFGILLAYFFKLLLATFKKLKNKTHDIIIFLIKILVIIIIYFFLFYILYFIFSLFTASRIYYWYTPFSWDYPPVAPYYLLALSVILSFFLGKNKKYLVYNITLIILLFAILLLKNINIFSYDIKRLYVDYSQTSIYYLY